MYYPFLVYSQKILLMPIFSELEGDPFVADLSRTSPLLKDINVRDQRRFQSILDKEMEGKYRWGFSPYLEQRDSLLADCPQMVAESRFIHLGLDIIVPLGTLLHAPLDAIVEQSGYESGEGNYGGYVLLKHESPFFETFYSFYGHLGKDSLPPAGNFFPAGQSFAQIGRAHV